jgi:pyrimidine-nucleoside phosphorylase
VTVPFADLIEKKRNGGELSHEELESWVAGITGGGVPDYQSAAMLMAVYFRGMTPAETAWFTRCIAFSGDTIDLSGIAGMKCDKHSSGGVADTVSLPLIAIAASCGAILPKLSGRGLGHTGGTIDKLEAIPGFNVNLDRAQFVDIVNKHGAAIMAQTQDVAPADKLLYSLRDVTATINSIPLIASSIMGKKLATGADVIVLDVKWGTGAFMPTVEEASKLAKTMVDIGEDNGKRTIAFVTDMNEPLGSAVGNALEVLEAVEVLKGGGSPRLNNVILTLCDEILLQSGIAPTAAAARTLALEAVSSGRALQRFREIVVAQGGDPAFTDDPGRLPTAPVIEPFIAETSGFVSAVDAKRIGGAAMLLGAGRRTKSDTIDLAVGLTLDVCTGMDIRKGQRIGAVHARSHNDAARCGAEVAASIRTDTLPVRPLPVVAARISRAGGVVTYPNA